MNWPLPCDALGVETVDAESARSLLINHAPALEIDVATDYDLPGTVVLNAQALACLAQGRSVRMGCLCQADYLKGNAVGIASRQMVRYTNATGSPARA